MARHTDFRTKISTIKLDQNRHPEKIHYCSAGRLDSQQHHISTASGMAKKAFCVLIVCYLVLLAGPVSQSGSTPGIYPQSESPAAYACGQYDPLQDVQLMGALSEIHQELGPPGCNPPRNRSCQEIFYCFPLAPPSGYHEIRVPNGSLVQVYCDMEGANCGVQGGSWLRVAHVNMTQSSSICPQGLTQKDMSGLRLCGQTGTGCQGTIFSALGLNYSRVCGQLRGYQNNAPSAFSPYNQDTSLKVNEHYVDGASITYGTGDATKHIWTYATGVSYSSNSNPRAVCPCNVGSPAEVPPYVGNDYYCETGFNSHGARQGFRPDDPLWNGEQCAPEERPCCDRPGIPWFTKTLSEATTEDIQLRLCGGSGQTILEFIELFVM